MNHADYTLKSDILRVTKGARIAGQGRLEVTPATMREAILPAR
jgi:hypothetical protein